VSQNPPDNPFGSEPPDDPFGKPPADDPFGKPPSGDPGPQSAADIWRRASEQQKPPPPPPPHEPLAPPPPPQGYYGGPPVGAQKAEGAITSLVLGIIGIVVCQLCAPFAWAMGRKAERLVDASGGTLGGRGEATAGKILGIIGTVFLILIVLFIFAIIAFGVALESSSTTTFEEF
jgi:hypothetical protein